jgi:hypothetical protein
MDGVVSEQVFHIIFLRLPAWVRGQSTGSFVSFSIDVLFIFRLWYGPATEESTVEELQMLGGPVQWMNVKTITTMLTEKVVQGEGFWWLRSLRCHSAVVTMMSGKRWRLLEIK